MEAYQGVLLGILQGVTEWIPVSSEGQTMLVMIRWLQVSPADAISYSIFLHLGTMFAVLIRFRHKFLMMIKELNSKFTRIVIVSTFCTGITGLPLYLLFRESFLGGREATLLIGALLIATGLFLRFEGPGSRRAEDMTMGDMVSLGLAQGFSILPGVSRSGTTLTVLLIEGIRQEEALMISLIISVPAVLGAIVLDRFHTAIPWETAGVMFMASLIMGYLTMNLLIRFSREISFSRFCIALGLVTLLLAI